MKETLFPNSECLIRSARCTALAYVISTNVSQSKDVNMTYIHIQKIFPYETSDLWRTLSTTSSWLSNALLPLNKEGKITASIFLEDSARHSAAILCTHSRRTLNGA
jgi:hypothetical protein